MESILDDLDAMIGELDDLNFNPNEIKPKIKKHLDGIEVDGKEKQSDEGFAALISELASFNPEPVKTKPEPKLDVKEPAPPPNSKPPDPPKPPELTNGAHGLSNGALSNGEGLSNGVAKPAEMIRSKSDDSKVSSRKNSVSNDFSKERTLSRSNTERKRTLSRQNSGLETFTLMPSPSDNMRIHMSEGNIIKTVRVERAMTAWDLCISLVLRNHYKVSSHWTLVEQLVDISCERVLEDHEVALKLYKKWPADSTNKLCLVENEKKWDFLEHPQNYFPQALAEECAGKDEDYVLEILTREYFSESPPPVEGYLYCKDAKHSWSKKYFVLRSSGLYYSGKGKSKAPQDLTCFTTLQDIMIYYCVDARTDHKAPTEHAMCFIITTKKTPPTIKDLCCVAAETEQEMLLWYEALRVMKYGDKISENRAISLLEVAQELEKQAEERRNAPPPTPPPIATIPKAATEATSVPSPTAILKALPIAATPSEQAAAPKVEEPTQTIMVPSGNPHVPWAPIPVSISTPKFPLFNPISTTPPPQKPVPPPPTHQKPVIPAKSPDLMKPVKSPPPPPMSPKPVLDKAGPVVTAPKPSPLPTRRMKLPAPPMKPNFTPPLPPHTASSPATSNASASPEPLLNSFQEMQAQLAKSFNASPIKAVKPVEIPAKPAKPVKPTKPVPHPVAVDDLPPPPVDFLVAQPAITPKPTPKPQPVQPQRVVETMGPKISDILKNMQPPVTEPKPPARFNSKSKSISLHTPSPPPHTANLIRSLTCPQLPPQQSSLVARMAQELAEKMVQKPPHSGDEPQDTVGNLPPQQHNGMLSRANNVTEPRADPPRQNSVGHLPQHETNPPMPRSRTFGDLPIHQVNHLQPSMRPPIAHFASPYIPPPNHDQLVRPEQVQMIMRPLLDHQIRPVMNQNMVLDHQIRPNMRPEHLQLGSPQAQFRPMTASPTPRPIPSPQFREIRQQSPQCSTPPLPSRKDSLLASQQRSRTISGSSGGSSIPALRGDNIGPSSDNLATRPQQPPSPVTTASPHNASSTIPYNTSNTIPYSTGTLPRGVPNMLQRNTSPYLHKPPVPTPWQQENLCRDWAQEQDQNNNTINVGNQGNQGQNIMNQGQQNIMGNQSYRMPQRDSTSPQRPRIPQHLSDSSLPIRNTLRNNNSLRNGSPVVANHLIGSQGTIGGHGNQGNHGYPPGNYNYPPSVLSNVSHTPSNGSSNSEEVVYEYIPEEPHKDQHLHNWLHSYSGPYDDDALSIASEHGMMSPRGGPPVTPPPRSDSKKVLPVDHTAQPWFHGSISRDAANSLLSSHGKGDGLFLVRNSSNCNTGDLVLSMTHSGQVKHFQITQRGGRPPWYAIEDGPAFPDVIQLIRHYSQTADRLPAKLSSYCMSS